MAEKIADIYAELTVDDGEYTQKINVAKAEVADLSSSTSTATESTNRLGSAMSNTGSQGKQMADSFIRMGLGRWGTMLQNVTGKTSMLGTTIGIAGAALAGWKLGRMIAEMRVFGDTIEGHVSKKIHGMYESLTGVGMWTADMQQSDMAGAAARRANRERWFAEDLQGSANRGREMALAEAEGEDAVLKLRIRRIREERAKLTDPAAIAESRAKETELYGQLAGVELRKKAEEMLVGEEEKPPATAEFIGLADILKKAQSSALEKEKDKKDDERNKLLKQMKDLLAQQQDQPVLI